MLHTVLFLIYFALPGGLANMAPVFAAKGNWFKTLAKPIDGGRSFRGKRIFGDHKTYRGFYVGFLFAAATALVQLVLYLEYEGVREFSLVEYTAQNFLIIAGSMTLGALGGDAIKSFFKRQAGIKPGHSWIPFDQMDSMVGMLVVETLFVDTSLTNWLVALLFASALHPVATSVGWLLKLKERPL